MDRKVLEAYAKGDRDGGWLEVEVPPYCPTNDEDKKKLELFEGAVIDRLFVLNAKRAEEEKIKGGGAAGGKRKIAKGAARPKGEKRRGKKMAPEGQLGLGDGGKPAPESS